MANFDYRYQQRIEQIYYKHGLFMSNHPILMICVSAIGILCSCYPLLNLPLPGSEPMELFTPIFNFNEKIYTSGKELPYDHLSKLSQDLPHWFRAEDQVAYVQQFLVKSLVHPWNDKEMVVTDAYRAPLSKIFSILEEIENFHLRQDESRSITKQCLHVSESIIKPKETIKSLFPEYSCLILSPVSFWKKSLQGFYNDPHIVHTLHKYHGKTLDTSPSVKELLFGVPSKASGVNTFMVRNRQRAVTYAITVVLRDYDSGLISAIKAKLQTLYPSKLPNFNYSTESSRNAEIPVVTHIHFRKQIGSNELIPLLSTYFIMGCYVYFSVRKINFVKSKLGMAFSAVISIMASLMMSVGLCSLIGLKPVLNGGEIFPYLVIIIGLENILVITKSVVATPIHLEVDKRIALGLSREGCSITKNLLLELILIGLGYFTFVPEIQEFCAFAVVGILSDYFMHMVFFTTILSIDIRRLDISECVYGQLRESNNEVRNNDASDVKSKRVLKDAVGRKNDSWTKKSLRSSKTRMGNTDEIYNIETGGKKVTILKIPKRLRVLFFWADTRMVQRGLMVCMVIWFALLMYGDPFGKKVVRPDEYSTYSNAKAQQDQLIPMQKTLTYYKQEIKKVFTEPLDMQGNLLWRHSDLLLHRRLSFRHWPTLFGYYNISLAGRFVSILPPVPLTVTISPSEAIKARHSSEILTQQNPMPETVLQDDSVSRRFSPYPRYPETGLDYYLTLLLGAVSGMMMVFFFTMMYRCICTRNYANWRTQGRQKWRPGTAKYKSSIGDTMPLVLRGHPQNVDCVMCDDGLLASTDLTGEVRVWDIYNGNCNIVIHRVKSPVPERDPAEGAIDAKPTPLGYQANDHLNATLLTSTYQLRRDAENFGVTPCVHKPHAVYVEEREHIGSGHRRQQSWHNNTLKSRRTHHRSSSGGHHLQIPQPVNSNTEIFPNWLSPFSPEISMVPTINTDFTGIGKRISQLRRRVTTPKQNEENKESGRNLKFDYGTAGYDFEGVFREYFHSQVDRVPDMSSLGNLARLFQREALNKNSKSSAASESVLVRTTSKYRQCESVMFPELGQHFYPAETISHITSTNDISCSNENVTSLCGSREGGLGEVIPKSELGSWGFSPGSPIEMENGPSVWCMIGLRDFIITGCETGRIEVWDGKSGVLKCTHDVGKAGVVGLVAEDKKVVAARVTGSLDFFSMEATCFHNNSVQYRGHFRTRLNSADDMLCSDVLTLQLLYTIKSAHQQPITAFKMAMGRVLTGSCDHTLKLFTAQDAQCLFTLYGHKKPISALCMDPGPPAGAVSGSSDGTIRLWDLPSGRCLHMLDEHKGEVTSVRCSDTHIVSVAQDDQLCIWTRTGFLLHARCLNVGCSVDMCLLGSSWCVTGDLGYVLLWDMRNGELVRKIPLSDESTGLATRVSKLVPVANLAVACDTGRKLQIVRFPSVLEKID